jgi:Putative Actinobacterial Holin-X, holin superfamily III
VLFLVAGLLALIGRREVRRATPPAPRDAAASVRADVQTLTAAVRDRHNNERADTPEG